MWKRDALHSPYQKNKRKDSRHLDEKKYLRLGENKDEFFSFFYYLCLSVPCALWHFNFLFAGQTKRLMSRERRNDFVCISRILYAAHIYLVSSRTPSRYHFSGNNTNDGVQVNHRDGPPFLTAKGLSSGETMANISVRPIPKTDSNSTESVCLHRLRSMRYVCKIM